MTTGSRPCYGLFRDLERPGDVFVHLGSDWFASVMGTGIGATAAATLPVQWPGLRGFATAIWVLSALWLVVLTGAEVVHKTRHRSAALGHARRLTGWLGERAGRAGGNSQGLPDAGEGEHAQGSEQDRQSQHGGEVSDEPGGHPDADDGDDQAGVAQHEEGGDS